MRSRLFTLLKLFILILIHTIPLLSFAQITRVKGKVIDANTKEALPFCNVSFIKSTVGTITDQNGFFSIDTKQATDSISAQYVGYTRKSVPVKKYTINNYTIELTPINYTLQEVVVRPGENPAHAFFKKIIANKDRNNVANIPSYSYNAYTKMQIDVNNIKNELKDKKLLKQFKFVFDYLDTNKMTGKTYIPILISESLSNYYYSSSPKKEKEVIKASKTSGIDNKSIAQFTGRMYQNINIYDNFIDFFDQGLISPLNSNGLSYYKYYLQDTAYIDGKQCIRMNFIPKRKQEPTFTGEMWVHDTTYAVVKVVLQLNKGANINWVNAMATEQVYQPVNDSVWFPKSSNLFIDFKITKGTVGFFGRNTSVISNVKLNAEFPDSTKKNAPNVILSEEAIKKDTSYWAQNRPVELTTQEKGIYTMVDRVKEVPLFKTATNITNLLINYYYPIGYFEYGPYYQTYSNNKIEGDRFKFGGRTSNKFSTKIMVGGFAAYGFKDEKFKYGGDVLYMFSKEPRVTGYASYKKDMEQMGLSPFSLAEDNILTSVLRRNPNYKLNLIEQTKFKFDYEWSPGISSGIEVNYKDINASDFVTMKRTDGTSETHMPVSNIVLSTRIGKGERFVSGEFERVSLGSNNPIININATFGLKNVLGSKYSYTMLDANYVHKVPLNPFGYLRYIIEGGKIFGTVPYPLLKLHEGNETYALNKFSFNMMNYYEFASDQWVSLTLEHHFNGFFLNHIPLMRKLKWREVAYGKGLIGSLSNTNKAGEFSFPDGLSDVRKPYYEVGVGIENIFKIIRIDAIWRLSYLDNPNIDKFGIRAGLQIIF
jgi:hypothetical protein